MTQGKEIDSIAKPTVKRLTPVQVNEYRKKGMCFKCDDKFLPGYKYSVKKIMMIEINYPEDEEEEIIFEPKEGKKEGDAEISIHTMEGNASSQTIRLMGYIHNKPVSILLDTQSTHNFMNPRVIQRAGLKLTPEPSFRVVIAGDDKLYSEGCCQLVHINCQGKQFINDFHVLPIGGCHMVLRVGWLKTFDTVTLSCKEKKKIKQKKPENFKECRVGIQY